MLSGIWEQELCTIESVTWKGWVTENAIPLVQYDQRVTSSALYQCYYYS